MILNKEGYNKKTTICNHHWTFFENCFGEVTLQRHVWSGRIDSFGNHGVCVYLEVLWGDKVL
jgi:hypothetical protein